jgi:hypothetical protein
MPVPASGYDGIREEANVLVGQKEFEIGSHIAQLHGEVLALHRNRKDAFKVVNGAVATQREHRNLPSPDVGGLEEGNALDVIPMKMGEGNDDRLVAQGIVLHDVPTQMPYSSSGVDDPNVYRVVRSNEGATGASSILIKIGSANGN